MALFGKKSGDKSISKQVIKPSKPKVSNKKEEDWGEDIPETAPPATARTAISSRPPGATHARKTNADDIASMKQKAYYSDDVMLKMTTLLYDPLTVELCRESDVVDVSQLLGLTNIKSSREAFYWAHRIATESYANRYRPGGTGSFHIGINGEPIRKWSIAKIEMVAFLIARRSMTMPVGSAFALGVGLAQEQAITKSEEAGEENEW